MSAGLSPAGPLQKGPAEPLLDEGERRPAWTRAAEPTTRHVLGPEAAGRAGVAEIGAKAASLAALGRDGSPVPGFACVTTAVFDAIVLAMPGELRDELEQLRRDHASLHHLSERAQAHVRATGPALLAAAGPGETLEEILTSAFEPGELLAVRSSSYGEDSAHASFAGQFETFLCVPRDRVAARVVDCIASAFSPHALMYQRLRGLRPEALRMAVVIQSMVDSAASGVVFTADPHSGREDRVILTAGLGLGQGVVDGRVEVDTFVLDGAGTITARTIEAKSTRIVPNPDGLGGTRLDRVAPAASAAPAVSDVQAQRIARAALALAQARQTPQDVEWAIDSDGRLYVLQSRPITTAAAASREQIFDNSNLVESYPGETSPLTFSLMRRGYEVHFRELVRTFGAPEALVNENRDAYANLVGLLNGRMYYNLSNWYRMFLQIPGMERALPAFETAMGFPSSATEAPRIGLAARIRWVPRQAAVAARLITTWITIPRRARDFRATYTTIRERLDHRGVDGLDAHELVDELERSTQALFEKMAVGPINDFFTQQVYDLLGRLIAAWDLGDQIALRNELLCGVSGMESVEPVRSLVGLAERIRSEAEARALIESDESPAQVWDTLQQGPAFHALGRALALHVERHGDRSLDELKLESTTLVDDPSALIAMLRNYLRGGQDIASMEAREQGIRSDAEALVAGKLRRRPLRRAIFAFVLGRSRAGLKTRESVRLTRSRQAGLFRRLYRALGDRFVEDGLLDRREDVFLLTTDEVADAVRGAGVTRGLRELVALRRSEYAFAAREPAPSRICASGIVEGGSFGETPAATGTDGEHLTGTGCSPGRVRAPAMVIEKPAADLSIDGEILVANTTDPGWVFLMVAAGGLISEQGNVLSHTAIIGRELGIPTVVGVKDAMRAIPDGAVVELDGRSGTVAISERAA